MLPKKTPASMSFLSPPLANAADGTNSRKPDSNTAPAGRSRARRRRETRVRRLMVSLLVLDDEGRGEDGVERVRVHRDLIARAIAGRVRGAIPVHVNRNAAVVRIGRKSVHQELRRL